jgi:hypothetical protein
MVMFAAGELAVFQGASEAPISRFIRVESGSRLAVAGRKNSPSGRGQEVALKIGRRLRLRHLADGPF